MPIYTYICNDCNNSEDKLSSFEKADELKFCKNCDKDSMQRDTNTVYKTQLNFKGRWFKNAGSY